MKLFGDAFASIDGKLYRCLLVGEAQRLADVIAAVKRERGREDEPSEFAESLVRQA